MSHVCATLLMSGKGYMCACVGRRVAIRGNMAVPGAARAVSWVREHAPAPIPLALQAALTTGPSPVTSGMRISSCRAIISMGTLNTSVLPEVGVARHKAWGGAGGLWIRNGHSPLQAWAQAVAIQVGPGVSSLPITKYVASPNPRSPLRPT